jgi:omega-6 fatty acid desaturase (delta-12 desaturase)
VNHQLPRVAPDEADHVSTHPDDDGRRLARGLAPFRAPSDARALSELAFTAGPLVALWAAAAILVRAGVWPGLLLTIPAGAFLLRLFLIQHDCGHGSFFRHRVVNRWVGRSLGVVTLTPYDDWRHSHALHHASTGNLDRRGFGDIDTLTLEEYRARSTTRRCLYRLYRNPLVLFGVGPAFQFFVRHRAPAAIACRAWHSWLSVMATNSAIAMLFGGLILAVGLVPFLAVQLPVTLVAATGGMWLFYVQHQFPSTTWRRGDRWSHREASLHGSSFYDLPPVARWFTANIGIHHVHHLCSTIPFYRLDGVLRAFPELTRLGRLKIGESFGTVRLTLWDEANDRLISFRDAGAA